LPDDLNEGKVFIDHINLHHYTDIRHHSFGSIVVHGSWPTIRLQVVIICCEVGKVRFT